MCYLRKRSFYSKRTKTKMRLDQMPLEVQKQMLETAKTEIEFHTQFLEVWKEEIGKYIAGKKPGGTFYQIPAEIIKEREGYFKNALIDDDNLIKAQTDSLKSATDSIDSQIGKIEIQIAFKKTSASVSIIRSSGGGAKTKTWPQTSVSGKKYIKFDAEYGILADDLNQFYEKLQDFSAYVKITAYSSLLEITELDYDDLPPNINEIKNSPGFPIIADNAGKPNLPISYDEGYPIKNNGTGSTWYISFKETTGLGINFELVDGSSTQTINESEFSAQHWALDISSPKLAKYKIDADARRLAKQKDLHGKDWWKGFKDTKTGKTSLYLGDQLFFTFDGVFVIAKLYGDLIRGDATYEKLDTVPALTPMMIGTSSSTAQNAEVTAIEILLKTPIWKTYRTRLLAASLGAVNIEFEVGDPFQFISKGYWIKATLLLKQADPIGELQYYFRVRDTSAKISGLTSGVAAAASIFFSGITKGTASIIPTGTLTSVTNALNSYTYDKNHFYEVNDTYMQTFSFDLNAADVDEIAKKDEPILRELATLDPLIDYVRIIQLMSTLFYKSPETDRKLAAATAAKNTADAKELADLKAEYDTILGSTPSEKDRKKEILRKFEVLGEDNVNGDKITDLLAALDTTPGGSTFFETYNGDEVAKIEEFRKSAKEAWGFADSATFRIPYRADIPFFVRTTITETELKSPDWFNYIWFIKGNQKPNSGIQFRNLADGGSYSNLSDVMWKYTLNDPDNKCTVKRILDPTLLQKIKDNIETNKGLPSQKIK